MTYIQYISQKSCMSAVSVFIYIILVWANIENDSANMHGVF